MAVPPPHKDIVAQAFTRILTECPRKSPYSLLVYGSIALLSNKSCTKVLVDLVSARVMELNFSHFVSLGRRAEPLINLYICERALFGAGRRPDDPMDDYLRYFLDTVNKSLLIAEAAQHADFYFFLNNEETQTLRKIKSNFREGASEFGLPPGFSSIEGTALATVKMRSTENPADIRDIIVFCGGSVMLEDEEYPEPICMPFDNLHIFDINQERFERWQTLPDLFRTKTIVVSNNFFYVYGFPTARDCAHAVAVDDNKWLFVIGGGRCADSRAVWRLDIASSRWSRAFQISYHAHVLSAAYCRLSGRLLVVMNDLRHNSFRRDTVPRFRMDMFRIAVPSLAWISFSKVLSLLKPVALADVHGRFGFGVPGPSVNVAEATSRITDILYAD